MALQVDDQHLYVVNDTRIADGKKEQWPIPVMAEIIAAEVSKRHIDTVRLQLLTCYCAAKLARQMQSQRLDAVLPTFFASCDLTVN